MNDISFEANLPQSNGSVFGVRLAKYGLLGTTALCAASLTAPAAAGPTGGTVVRGDASISKSGATTTVTQRSKKASLTWSSLDVGQAETLRFAQPGADSIALNRVLSDLPTHILGNLTANGNVWIVNPNGVAFGPNSVVDVGGLLASTRDILDSKFWADDFSFSALTGSEVEYSKITAEGKILAGKGGVVLVAPVIETSGLITTTGGNIALATAQAFRVDFDGDGLLSFTVEAGAEGVLQLSESSAISATGGAVYLSAGAADAVTESVVNVGGSIDATRVAQQGGEIILSGGLGGEVIVTAELSAIGGAGETGGSIDVFGDTITLASGASLDVSGEAGGGSIRVGGDYQGGGDAPTAKTTWVTEDALLTADATVDGDGGRVIVWSDETTVFEGSLSAVGAGWGDGGFAEISGKQNLSFSGEVDLSAVAGDFGTLLLDPENIRIVASGSNDGQIGGDDGTIDAGDGSGTFTISASELEGLNNSANVILSANGDITFEVDLSLDGGGGQDVDFTLNAGDDITLNTGVSVSTDGFIDFNASGSIILSASASLSTSDNNSNPDIDLDAGDQIILGDNASISAEGALTLTADGDANDNAAIVFGADSSITAGNGSISVTSAGGSDTDNNSILLGGGFSANAPDTDDDGDGTITFTSDDQIIFGAVLDGDGDQEFSSGAITIESDDGATFSAGLDIIFMSDPDSTMVATIVGVTGSVLFDVTGASDANDIIFRDDAAFTVSGGTAEFETTTNGDIEIQQDVSISATSTGSLTFDSADDVLVGVSVTISADADINIEGGQTFIASDVFTLDAGSDLTFETGGTTAINASGAITLMAGQDIIVDDNMTITGAPSVKFDAGRDFNFAEPDPHSISSSADLTIEANNDIDFGFNEDLSGSGTITIIAQDNIDFGSSVDILASGSILIEAGFIDDSNGGTIDIGDNFNVDSGSGSVSIVSNLDDDNTTASNDITFEEDATIEAATTILIDSFDRVFLGSDGNTDTITFNASGGTTIRAAGNVTLGADSDDTTALNVTGGLTIDTADINLDTGSTINVGTETVIFTPFDDGQITIGGSGGLGVSESDLAKITAGEIAFETDGDIDVDSLSFDDADTLSLTAGGGVTFGDGTSTITADLVIEATGTVEIDNDSSLVMSGAGHEATITSGDIAFGNGSSEIDAGTGTLTLVNVDTDTMTLAAADTGSSDDWDITTAEYSQISAGQVEFQTAGEAAVDGFSQASDTANLVLQATGAITIASGATSTFAETATLVAGEGAGTGDAIIAGDLSQPSGVLTIFGENVTQTGGAIDSSGTIAFNAGEGATFSFTGDVTVTQDGNVFTNAVDAQGVNVMLGTTGTLPIGLVSADNAIFDAGTYDIDASTGTTFVDVGTGTATLFFGSETVTVTDAGASDTLDLTSVDEDDFGFVNSGAAVGVGTAGDITVDGANWMTQGISLISTTGSVTFSTTASSFGGAISIQSSGSITQDVELSSSGTVSFQSDNDITLTDASNSFTGAVSVDGAVVTLVNNGATTLGEVKTTGAFDLTSAGNVLSATGTSSFEVGGSTNITIDTATDATVQLVSNGTESLSFGDLVTIDTANMGTIGDVEIVANGPLSVAALDIGGDLALTGNVTDTTTTGISQTAEWDVSGSTSLDAGLGDIVVTNASNTFTAGLSLFGDDASATVDTDVALNNVDLTGNLVLNAVGSISQDPAGSVTIGMTATFTPDAAGTVVLDNATNDFGTVAVTTGVSASFGDANAIDIGAMTLSGGLIVNSVGAVTQSAAITGVTGEVDITSSSTVTLDNGSNDFSVLSLQADSATVSDTNALELGDVSITNGLSIATGGAVSDDLTDGTGSNSVIVGGLLTANVGDADVILDNATNNFGSISLVAVNATIVDSDDGLDIAGANLTGGFALTTTDDATDGDITQSAPVDISGTTTINADGGDGDIALDNVSNSFTGAVTLTGDEVSIASTGTLTLGAIVASDFSFSAPNFVFDEDTFNNVSGTVTFVAQPGRDFLIGEDDYILGVGETFGIASGTTTYLSNAQIDILEAEASVTGVGFETGDDIYVDGLVATLDVTLNASGTVQFIDALSGSIATTSITGDLTVNAGESVTQFNGVDNPDTFLDIIIINGVPDPGEEIFDNLTANLTVSGLAEFNAGDDVLLTNSGNAFSTSIDAVSGSADIFSVRDVNSIALGEISASESVTITSGGSVFVNDSISSDGSILLTAAGSIFDNGIAVDDAISAGTTLTANATSSVSLNEIDIGATTSISITAVSGSADLADITSGGTVNVNSAGGTGSVTLDGVSATGAVTVTSGGAITLGNGLVQTGNNLSLTAGGTGDITDTGTGSVQVTGTTLLSAAGDSVILNNVANDFGGAVTIMAADATIVDANAIALGAVTLGNAVANDFTLTANADGSSTGTITQSAAMTANDVNIQAGGGDVTLTQANLINGVIDVTANNLNITNNTETNLGAISLPGDLTVTSNLAQVDDFNLGVLNVSGTTNVTATGRNVYLSGANDFDGAVSVTAGAIQINDTDDLTLGTLNATTPGTGFTYITAGGPITGSQNITAADYLYVRTNGASGSINLTGEIDANDTAAFDTLGDISVDNASNDFTGNVAVRGVDVMLQDTNNIVFGPAVGLSVSTVSGELTLTAGGSVTDTGQIIVNGTDTSTISAGSAVILDNATNDYAGPLAITATSAVITDVDDITLADINLGAGALTVNAAATGGATAISQVGGTGITAGNASFNGSTAGDVVLTEAGNAISGAITIVSANDATISGDFDLLLGGASLFNAGGDLGDLTLDTDSVTALAAINVPGDLTVTVDGGSFSSIFDVNVTGATDINAASQTVHLTSGGNTFGGPVTIDASTATLTIDNTGILFGDTVIEDLLTIFAFGDVNQSASTTITGGASVTVNANALGVDVNLFNTGNDFSHFELGGTANSLALRDSVGDITFGPLSVATNLSLSVVGAINATDSFDIDGLTLIEVTGAGNDIVIDNAGNTFGVDASDSLTINTNGGDVTINGSSATGDVTINGASVTSDITTIGGTLGVTASSDIDVSGTSAGGDVNLDGASVTSNIGTVGGAMDVSATSNVDIDGSSVTGDVDVVSSGSVSVDIAVISGTLDIDATSDIDVTATSVSSSVLLDGASVTANVDTIAGNLNVTATSDIDVTSSLVFGDVRLNGASVTSNIDTIGGNLNVTGTSDVDIFAGSGVVGNVTAVGDDVSIDSDIVLGSVNVTADGDVDLTAGTGVGGDVNLEGESVTVNVTEIVQDLDVTATSHVDIDGTSFSGDVTVDGDDVDIDVTRIGGVLDVDAGGDINVMGTNYSDTVRLDGVSVTSDITTISGNLNVTATSDIDVGGSSVTGAVTLNGDDVNSTISNIGGALNVDASEDIVVAANSVGADITLDGVSVTSSINSMGGALNVDATSNVDVSGVKIAGNVNIDGDMVLIDIGNIGGLINVTGSDTTLISDAGVTLGTLRITGDLDIDVNNGAGLNVVNAGTTAISQSGGGSINVTGDTTLDLGGADIDLLNGSVASLENLDSALPFRPNSFGGTLSITGVNDAFIVSSSDLKIGTISASGAFEPAEVIIVAPDIDIFGAITAPTVRLFGASGSTKLGDGLAGGGLMLSESELQQITAGTGLYIYERGVTEIGDLSLSGSDLGLLAIFNDGNVVISGELTSNGLTATQANALNLHIQGADNIHITGKLGVEGEDTLLPLGDLTLLAKNDILIGDDFFVTLTNTAQLSGPNIEINLERLDEIIVSTVGAGPNLSNVTFGGSGNIAMQTTNGDTGTGLDIGNLTLTNGRSWNDSITGAPEFINLFGSLVLGNPGSTTDGIEAAAAITLSGIGINPDYEFNGCIIGGSFLQCTAFGTIATSIPFDDSLFLDLDIEPEEEEDDDPFTNRGNEEEWR